MDALGNERFAVVGTDTGLPISYALAADHPGRVERVALAEVPGPPGAVPQPPLFLPEPLNNKLWHIPVNRLDKLNEQLAVGREDLYFGYEFAIQAATKLPDDVVAYDVGLLTNPDSLRGTFAFYREWDTMEGDLDAFALERLDQRFGRHRIAGVVEDEVSSAKHVTDEAASAVVGGILH
jgi:pimeloyl-ACP methyl ester carboxylesterase